MVLLGVASLAVAGSRSGPDSRRLTAAESRARDRRPCQIKAISQRRRRRVAPISWAAERDLDQLLESMVARVDYYESLLASVNIGLLAVDLDGRVVGANATAARWLTPTDALAGERSSASRSGALSRSIRNSAIWPPTSSTPLAKGSRANCHLAPAGPPA